MLRIYIESANGVSVDDCAMVSRQVSDLLDVSDEIVQEYTLEVSSPGLDRTLFQASQFAAYIGEQIDVRLNFPFEGKKRIRGQLVAFEDNEVIIAPPEKSPSAESSPVEREDENEEYVLPFENVRKVKLVPHFGSPKAEQSSGQ